MSLSGTTNTYLPPTLDGLTIIDADAIYINGQPVDTENLVPYTGATKNVNLGTFNFQTLGSISAKEHIFPNFNSTLMTGPTISSIFTADAWGFSNTISTVSLGPVVSTSYLTLNDITNNSTIVTFQSDGIANFDNTKIRLSTMASHVYDAVNLSTLTNAVAFIQNVNALNYVPYTGATNDLNMGASTIKTTGAMNAGYMKITSSISNADYTLSVNTYDQLEFTNLTTTKIFKTDGASIFLPTGGNVYGSGTTYSGDLQLAGTSYFAYGTGQQWGTTLNGSGEYEIQDDGGIMRLRLSKTTGLTVSTLNVTQVPSATPTLALGVNGSGGVVSFAVPTTTGFVPYTGATSNVNLGSYNIIANTARFTSIVSATPSQALGIDASGNLNKFAVPTYTDLLPLSNVWTGATNSFNFDVSVGGALGVNGNIVKRTASALSFANITGGSATNSPYLEFIMGGSSRGYIGNASATDLDVVAQNGAKLNFYTAGTNRMTIATDGQISVGTRLLGLPDSSPTGNFWLGLRGTGTESDRLAIGLVGNQTTGLVSNITFQKNATMAAGTTFTHTGGNAGTNYLTISGVDTGNTPYIGYWLGGVRKCYMGYANSTDMNIYAENNTNLNLGTQSATYLKITTGGETVSPTLGTYGQYRAIYGNYGWFIRNDGSNMYFLITASGDQYGIWNSLRPFYTNLATGRNTMEQGLNVLVSLGVGTTSPSYKLHVAGADGNIRAEGAIYCDLLYSTNPSVLNITFDTGSSVNWITNATGSKPIAIAPGTWANNGYTVISQSKGVNSPGLGLGNSSYPNFAGGRSVVISLAPGVAWGELIMSGATFYVFCYGSNTYYTNGGGWVYASDRRYKKDIKDIKTSRSLERIMALRPRTWKKVYRPDKTGVPVPKEVEEADHIGFVAQEVQESNPHCIHEKVDDNYVCDNDDGMRLGIAMGDINVHLVGAVQELKKQNDKQQEQIEDLKAYKTLSEERFEKMGRLIADQNKLLDFLMSKLK